MARDAAAVRYAMRKSCEYKTDIVAEDEKESGIGAILNLGHTFGHAIEASTVRDTEVGCMVKQSWQR